MHFYFTFYLFFILHNIAHINYLEIVSAIKKIYIKAKSVALTHHKILQYV